jgi:hypothetical protein
MTAPTIASVSTMGQTVPYITVAELKRSPIATQLQKLVPGSSDADRDAELGRIIMRVSAMINSEVTQNLAATVDTEVGRVRVSDDGDLRIHCRSNPIIEVRSISVGTEVRNLTEFSDPANQVVLDPWRITIPRCVGGNWRSGTRLWAKWTYVNGYPVTTLAQPALAGDTHIVVNNALGIEVGATDLTIEDGKWIEEHVVPTAINGNILTVPPLAFPHEAGVGCTALPNDLKEATLLLISRLHDTWSLSMGAITHDGSGASVPGAKVKRAMCDAAVMLSPYRRMW